jgi:phosphoglycerate dehydrogenase-like enzyme
MALVAIRGGLSDPVTEDRLRAIAEIFPEHEIRVIRDPDELLSRAPEVEICFGSVSPEFVEAAKSLRWLQWDAAGVNHIVDSVEKAVSAGRSLVFCSASGIHATVVSEHILALMFALSRRLHYAFRLQEAGEWKEGRGPEAFQLQGKHVLLVGVGAIGSGFAARAKALGMKVTGVRRRTDRPHEEIEHLVPPEELLSQLPEADFLVITTPLTDETRNLIGSAELSAMNNRGYLVNVGRGGIVDEEALYDALVAGPEGGGIAGAGLDVFDQEPLPPDARIRSAPNLVITPHYAGWTSDYDTRLWPMFLENARRYRENRELLSLVDPELGY